MRKKLEEKLDIPSGVVCELKDNSIVCTKSSNSLSKSVNIPGIKIEIKGSEIILSAERGNKNIYKNIISLVAHLKNLFKGLDREYVYTLEACNVHFPMTLKLEGESLIINNFLGEKTSRKAKIFAGVKTEIKGTKIILRSRDKEAAGLSAANIERATKVKNRDRRIFQDGIYITEKAGGDSNA
ncbi:MAG: 50S ribosomal protein L6 [Nanoarchaeota archaeon]